MSSAISASSASSAAVVERGPGILVATSPQIVCHRPLTASPPPPKVGESAETYPHVVAVLDATTRVIECAADQWIVQIRRRSGRSPWEGVSFCRTKEALLRVTGSTHPALALLPDRFS